MTDASASHEGSGADVPSPEPVVPSPEPAVEETGEIVLPLGASPVEVHALLAGRAQLASWALGIALIGLVVSFFVGWGFPLGIAAIVVAVIAVRRPWERRAVAIWGLVLGALSVIYSAGWLVYAALVTASR